MFSQLAELSFPLICRSSNFFHWLTLVSSVCKTAWLMSIHGKDCTFFSPLLSNNTPNHRHYEWLCKGEQKLKIFCISLLNFLYPFCFCVLSTSLSLFFSNQENLCLPSHSWLRVPTVDCERRGIFFTCGVQAGSVGQFWTEPRISLLLLTYTHKEELIISNV